MVKEEEEEEEKKAVQDQRDGNGLEGLGREKETRTARSRETARSRYSRQGAFFRSSLCDGSSCATSIGSVPFVSPLFYLFILPPSSFHLSHEASRIASLRSGFPLLIHISWKVLRNTHVTSYCEKGSSGFLCILLSPLCLDVFFCKLSILHSLCPSMHRFPLQSFSIILVHFRFVLLSFFPSLPLFFTPLIPGTRTPQYCSGQGCSTWPSHAR